MSSDSRTEKAHKRMLWGGRIISALPVLLLLVSGVMKLASPEPVKEMFNKLGYSEHVVFGIGLVEIACVALYVIPKTSILGAILITGYLGGATATHVRVAEPFHIPVLLGVLCWLGLLLREPRLRSLLPFRQ